MRIIACIEDPDVIEKILAHMERMKLSPRPPCGHRAGRHRSGDCSTRWGNPTMTLFGLCRQRRGNGVACPGNRREGEKCAGEAVTGENSRA